MDINKKIKFINRQKLSKGGPIMRKKYASGGALGTAAAGAAAGAAVAGPIGGVVGAIGGFLSSLFGGGPQQPNITDPISGQQITDANGQVVASQNALNAFRDNLMGVNGVQNQQAVLQHLDQIYSGTGGPNPAKAMLAEATGKNVAATSALMAGQRGAAGNVGLIAREAGQTGANIQQQSVAENAVIQAQQQLGALSQAGTIAGQQVAETQNAASTAGTQALNNQGQVLQGQTAYNSQVAGGQANVNTTNASILETVLPTVTDLGQGLLSGAGAKNVYENQPSSSGSTYAKGGRVHEGPHSSHVANYLSYFKGGKVPALVSPGEIYLTPDHVKEVQHGANPLKIGHKIPGKAKVKGDSLKNDTVEANLDEGGVVLPRHIVKGMSPEKAQLFVLKSLAKKKASHGK